MLETHNVTKTFGKNVTAVADVSLRLAVLGGHLWNRRALPV
jgi:hypothetical protein